MGFGLTLISIGLIWLLFKFNILTFSVFRAISDLWPLLLVVAGINLIFINRKIVSFIVWMLFLTVLIWYGQFGGGGRYIEQISGRPAIERDSGWTAHQMSEGQVGMDESVDRGTLKLDLGFGSLQVGDTARSQVDYVIPEDITNVYSRVTNRHLKVDIEQDEKFNFNWWDDQESMYKVDLPRELEWDIVVNTGAIDANFDLSQLNVSSLDIDCGAGDIKVTYGKMAPIVNTNIDCGATSIVLNVPEDAGVEINMNGLIKDNNFLNAGLSKKTDSVYRTDDFETQDLKLFIEIDTGVGDVTLNRY